jgi:2'-5' RNA ligase
MKTHSTAVVLIPSPDIWAPIQAIRQVHDRRFHRWMPHITLLYPFRPYAEFAALAPQFAALCEGTEPFPLTLTEIRYFRHRGDHYTLWAAPEPKEALVTLQAALEAIVPECHDVSRHPQGFTPHLSLGQVKGAAHMRAVQEALQAAWRPLTFTAEEVSLIWRREPPDDMFRIGQRVRLGRYGVSSHGQG